MVFVKSKIGDAMFLMLAEKDLVDLRKGLTKFVDERHTGGESFKQVIVSLHASNEAALAIIKQAGGLVPSILAESQPIKGESKCQGCSGVMPHERILDGRCIVCWKTKAEKAEAGRN